MRKSAVQLMREKHLEDNPNCTYGDQPHFVPPSFGDIGFYMCQVPDDIVNHNRCLAPFDHDHDDHSLWRQP